MFLSWYWTELLYGRRFPPKLEVVAYMKYVEPAIMCGCEAWYLKYNEMGILQRNERSMVRAMCGVQLKGRKRAKNLMLILDLSETIDKLAMSHSVRWYGQVLRREDGHVL